MLKKLCAIFLSACIAAAMILAVDIPYSGSTAQDAVTMCILEAEEELY